MLIVLTNFDSLSENAGKSSPCPKLWIKLKDLLSNNYFSKSNYEAEKEIIIKNLQKIYTILFLFFIYIIVQLVTYFEYFFIKYLQFDATIILQ